MKIENTCRGFETPFAFDPFPIELGHDNPTVLSADDQQRAYELVQAADKVMYQAKKSGKNQCFMAELKAP